MEDRKTEFFSLKIWFFTLVLCFLIFSVVGETNPSDFEILKAFREGLKNPGLLEWPPSGTDPCGPPRWPHVVCSGSRVTQIQVQNLGLIGPLPQNFNQLSELTNIGLQRNKFTGPLPTLQGLSGLQYAYLGGNQFDMIPSDFFNGLTSLEVLSLEYNPLNQSSGWILPSELQNSAQLTNLSLSQCNLIGSIPDFLGRLSSLSVLQMSYNNLSGEIPATFKGSMLQFLWLNNQAGGGISGSIDVIATMPSLTQLWLHGNQFNGTIPATLVNCASLTEIKLNNNQLVGPIPQNLTSMGLQVFFVDNNKLTGPIPEFKTRNFTFSGNSFCQSVPGAQCAPEVSALLNFLGAVNYPLNLASSWSGNDPCSGPWLGISCDQNKKVSVINFPNRMFNGVLSASIGELSSLSQIILNGNNLVGQIPTNLTGLKSLKLLNLSSNNLGPPIPRFRSNVLVDFHGNPLLMGNPPAESPSPGNNSKPVSPNSPAVSPSESPSNNSSSPPSPESTPNNASSPLNPNTGSNTPKHENPSPIPQKSSNGSTKAVVIVAVTVPILAFIPLALLCFWTKCRRSAQPPSSFVVHPRDPSDPDNLVKIVVANNANNSSTITASGSQSIHSTGTNEAQLIEAGNLVISVQVLRSVTKNFSPENELGRGGFGVVYKGELDDGTMIAVKRMESSVISSKAIDEFQAEIAVLSKVRHRHLVSLLGYSTEGNERLLVYEYMPQGALSKHLFHWQRFKMEPLSWKRRLNIALDVARGMEYLHSMAQQSFIHRDLKSSNILLGDDYRAKISDFGLVKLAPDGKSFVAATRLAGTFGYLAPEYAVTGKVTTKSDVFSYGVVLMELVTGLMALDEDRPEETRYLASWFWKIKSSQEKLMAAIDPALDVNEDTFESISIISELAGHCTAREANQRPDMGHAVNVLAPLVDKWKPMDEDPEEYSGIPYDKPLIQMVKAWQSSETDSFTALDDSKGSIPARPIGFAESFTSADGR